MLPTALFKYPGTGLAMRNIPVVNGVKKIRVKILTSTILVVFREIVSGLEVFFPCGQVVDFFLGSGHALGCLKVI